MKHRITKEFAFEAAHRLMNNKGKCANIHGHNYRVLVTVESDGLDINSMVIDFNDLELMLDPIIEKYDHTTLFNEKDSQLIDFWEEQNFKYRIFQGDPTAETIAKHLMTQFRFTLNKKFNTGLFIISVRIFENDKSVGEACYV